MKVLENKEQRNPAARRTKWPGLRLVVKQPDREGLRKRLSLAAQQFLWSLQESRSYSPRTAIFRMGDEPEGIFLIDSGEVSLWLERAGTYPLLLRTASEGEALGLSACVSGHPYEATAIAVSHCEVAFVSTENLVRLVERFPAAWVLVAGLLTANLSGAYQHVSSMRAATATGKGEVQCDADHTRQ